MSEFIEWSALARVVVAGVLIGAGIPAIFALGLRMLVGHGGGPTIGGERPGPGRLVLAGLCFVVVVGAVLTGIGFLVSGGH